ncbi:MAG TPA: 3-isopropylmalate dehydratase small subunit [Trueperaceae bacterium]|nr:3-isopropylmalate dehydratase small subunit [Trueperaceae bacterium]
MALQSITQVAGRAVLIAGDDIDTDRIIPARYLKCVTFDDLGEALFFDERFTEAGASKGHPLDDPERGAASIIVSGDNFGCGSSREHAPQSIQRAGFEGVIAASFAEIFFGNATALGLVCARLAPADLAALSVLVAADPQLVVNIDVANERVTAGDIGYPAVIGDSARDALVSGHYDPIGELLEGLPEVVKTARALGHEVSARSDAAVGAAS